MANHRTMPPPQLLDVELDLNKRILWIKFRYHIQAKAYGQAMKKHKRNPSIPRIHFPTAESDEWISMELPPTIIKIVACGGDEGFYFHFNDRKVSTLWEKELLIWKFVGGESRLAIIRDPNNARLRDVFKEIEGSTGRERGNAPQATYDPQSTYNSRSDPEPTYGSRADPPETRGASHYTAYEKITRRR